MSSRPVVVVGAGVIGLSVAHELSRTLGCPITIVAALWPTDILNPEYTLAWAGAHFRPFPNIRGNDYQDREVALTRVTQRRFRELAQAHPELLVRLSRGLEYWELPVLEYVRLESGYVTDMEAFEVLKLPGVPFDAAKHPHAALPGTKMDAAQFVAQYDTWQVNPAVYLPWLVRQLRFALPSPVRFVQQRVGLLREAARLANHPDPIVVNCSGTGLQWDGGVDPLVYPIRGQTLLVRKPGPTRYTDLTVTHVDKHGQWTFVIGRPLDGGYIVGGTKQVGETLLEPRTEDTAAIVARARQLYPDLLDPASGEFRVEYTNVGLRPARKTGFRLECEEGEAVVVHAYGAGGMGYELLMGVAEEVVAMVAARLSVPRL